MAASDARPVPRRNVAYRVTFPILDADGDLVTGATGLDSEVSKDGGTFADAGSEATEIATSSGVYFLDLTATEMDADTVAVIVKTTSAGAKTTVIVMYPESAGDYRADVTHWNGSAVAVPTVAGVPEVDVTHHLGSAVATPTVAGVPEVDVTHWLGAAVNALVGGDVPANVKQWLGAAVNALLQGRVQAHTGTLVGTADSGSTTTVIDAERTEADVDYHKGSIILFTSGTLTGQARLVTAFDPTTDTITFAPATTVAVASHTYILLPNSVKDVRSLLAAAITAAAFAVDSIDAAALATSAGQEVADRVLLRSIASGADGGRTVRSALRRIRNKNSIAGSTLTVTEEDDSTTDHTATVATAAGDPIISVDPT